MLRDGEGQVDDAELGDRAGVSQFDLAGHRRDADRAVAPHAARTPCRTQGSGDRESCPRGSLAGSVMRSRRPCACTRACSGERSTVSGSSLTEPPVRSIRCRVSRPGAQRPSERGLASLCSSRTPCRRPPRAALRCLPRRDVSVPRRTAAGGGGSVAAA